MVTTRAQAAALAASTTATTRPSHPPTSTHTRLPPQCESLHHTLTRMIRQPIPHQPPPDHRTTSPNTRPTTHPSHTYTIWYDLTYELQQLYRVVDNPTQECALQNGWQLYSLDTVGKLYRQKQDTNPDANSIDFAYTYHGMGHYVAASLHTTTGVVYYRLGGGSEYYSRMADHRFASSVMALEEGQVFTVGDWFGWVLGGGGEGMMDMGVEGLRGMGVVCEG